MLAGQPPHIGGSAQQIIMKIIAESTKPVEELRSSVPPNVAAAVAKSLEKLPADRFASARAFRDALGDPSFAGSGARRGATYRGAMRAGPSRRVLAAALVMNAVLVAALVVAWLRLRTVPAPSRQRVLLWAKSNPLIFGPGVDQVGVKAVLSPDGSSIVYRDSSAAGVGLMRKARGAAEPELMPGTERGFAPFFSPDGEWVGYFTTDGKMKKMPTRGGGSVTLADSVNADYDVAAWMDDNTILYQAREESIRRVASTGGATTALKGWQTRLSVESMWPLPGNRGFLFTGCAGNCVTSSDVYVYDLRADSAVRLVENAAGAWYAPTGQLLYTSREGGLYAADLDLATLKMTSGSVPVIDGVRPSDFALSASGAALYTVGESGDVPAELVWVTRDGVVTPIDSTWRGQFDYPAIAPDGATFAVSLRTGPTHIWVHRPDGGRQLFTHDGTVNWRPSWTPDGRSIAFISNRAAPNLLTGYAAYLGAVDGGASLTQIASLAVGLWEAELSRDGKWLVVRSDYAGRNELLSRRMDGDTTLTSLFPAVSSVTTVALSPDSRWIAFCSSESGRDEIYVAPFPEARSKRLVSRDGGTEPRWSHSGRELFFKSDRKLVALAIAPGPDFTPGTPHPLFSVAGYREASNRQEYDVAPGDRRFLMIREVAAKRASAVYYVENWLVELKAKMKGKGKG